MTKPPRESETHMPERLWLDADVIEEYSLTEKDEEFDYQTEYIRADKYAELEKQKSNAFYVLEHAEERIKQLQEQLSAATAALKEARDKALEEAAYACEGSGDEESPDCWDWHSKDYAKAIRALKSKRDGVE